jgi:hypothetical protein
VRPPSPRLAWPLAALGIGLSLLGQLILVLGTGVSTPLDDEITLAVVGHYVALYAFPLVGALIATRRPENAIGWLFVAIGLCQGITLAGAAYADYALFAGRASLPAGEWAAWFAAGVDVVFIIGIFALVLIFPAGRPPSPRWRWALRGVVAGGGMITLATLLGPGRVLDVLPVENPVAFEGAGTLSNVVGAIGVLFFAPAVAVTLVGAVLRFRRARGVERQQFKWFALAVSLLFACFLLTTLDVLGSVSYALIGIAFAGIPVSVGVAILRYRLYDIDRVISRTLVYAVLTLILGAAYAGMVLAGQAVFSSFAGGSDLAIAASTLVVAAAFLPARSRVQRFVDRRFYRRRYDAQRTLSRFGARLRDQVELDGLRADLEGVVRDTMQPAHVSLWLREGISP